MTDWFDVARLGLFVHWGPYSKARLEPSWPLVGGIAPLPFCQSLTVGEYEKATSGWAPPKGAPQRWAEMASAAGADYAVLTTKHHDGFTLFPSAFGHHGIQQTAPGRDLVGEFVTAMREAEIAVGLYFSLPDWHHRAYPAFTDEMRPYPAIAYPRPEPEVWEAFLADQRGQLTELLTRYGKIDLLWFDGGWERSAEEWRAGELERLIRELQPDIRLNDRCPGIAGYPSMLHEGVVPFGGGEGSWEACLPLDDSWGALELDANRKSLSELVGLLSETAATDGRLLVNVAPLGDGTIVDWQQDLLAGLASWTARNGRAIRAHRATDLAPGQFYGPVTRSGESLFLICPMAPTGLVALRQVRGKHIRRARVLGTGEAVGTTLRISALERMLSADPLCDVLFDVPASAIDDVATVIELEVDGSLA